MGLPLMPFAFFTALRNLFNEWMVKDTSKKIRAVKKAKGMSGKPITSRPPYGYIMGEDGHFLIDEEAAPVVRQIYALCLAGNGPTKIARMLSEQGIPTPGTLDYTRTGNARRYHPGYENKCAVLTEPIPGIATKMRRMILITKIVVAYFLYT